MLNKDNDNNSYNMQFDNGWWDFILSNEPDLHNNAKRKEEKVQNSAGITSENSDRWKFIADTYQNDLIIQVSVYGINKGGLLAKTDRFQGFIPISHILFEESPQSVQHRDQMLKEKIGKLTNVKIIEFNPSQNKIVLSERAALTEDGKRKELIAKMEPDTIVDGRVTNITPFGVFVDLGGIEGLVHLSELSWGRVRSPLDFVKMDDTISVLILSVDEDNMHVALSIKRLTPNPWFEIERKYKPGDFVTAEIVKILPYGAFACLQEGVEGLIHISTLKMDDKINDLKKLIEVGQQVTVEILHIDSKKHRLGLALVNPEI